MVPAVVLSHKYGRRTLLFICVITLMLWCYQTHEAPGGRWGKVEGHSAHSFGTLHFVCDCISKILRYEEWRWEVLSWPQNIKKSFQSFQIIQLYQFGLAKIKPHFCLSITGCKGIPRGLFLELFCILIIQWFKSRQQHHLLGSCSWNKCFCNSGRKYNINWGSFQFPIKRKRKDYFNKSFLLISTLKNW